MTATTIIKCDHCGRDLTEGHGTPDYRLVLHAEPLPNNTGFMHALLVESPLRTAHHYCGTGCLSAWLDGHGGR